MRVWVGMPSLIGAAGAARVDGGIGGAVLQVMWRKKPAPDRCL